MLTLIPETVAATSTFFLVSWSVEDSEVAVRMRALAPALAKAFAVAASMLRLAPSMAAMNENRNFCVEVEGGKLSILHVKVMPIHVGDIDMLTRCAGYFAWNA